MIDPPTIGERYSSAMESSDLRVRAERRGDVDSLIAAGWTGEGLGTMLYRLLVEFDSVRGQIGPALLSPINRLSVLDRLKSLRPTHAVLRVFAIEQAERKRFHRADRIVWFLVDRTLGVFLDPLCPHCGGRGFNGGSHRGEPQVLCRPCRGVGNRLSDIGRDDEERAFATHLLIQFDVELTEVDRQMRAFLRHV